MTQKSPSRFRGLWYYLRCNARRQPYLVNLEFTKRCNARCGFCSCWQVSSKNELEDYSPIVKKFRPVVCSISGGEPLLRKNYDKLLQKIRPYCHYLVLITNGALLNEDSAAKLANAGVNQICVSLDYLDSKHDEARVIPGLFEHLSKTIPHLTKLGYRIVLNTVIMESNLDEIIPLTYRASEWGAQISFSSYCSLKRDDKGMVSDRNYGRLIGVVDEIKRLKTKLKHIKSSDHYLDGIPKYFRDGSMPNCKAGFRWIQVAPDGYVQQCSELPKICYYTEFSSKNIKPAACSKCWYSCRGEAEANQLQPKRLLELIKA